MNLKKIARLRNIKNIEKLTKEELIVTLLKYYYPFAALQNIILKNL